MPWAVTSQPFRLNGIGQPRRAAPTKKFRRGNLAQTPYLANLALSLIYFGPPEKAAGILTIPIEYTKVYKIRWSKPLRTPPKGIKFRSKPGKKRSKPIKNALAHLTKTPKNGPGDSAKGVFALQGPKKCPFLPSGIYYSV
jgi:hypothetical protein